MCSCVSNNKCHTFIIFMEKAVMQQVVSEIVINAWVVVIPSDMGDFCDAGLTLGCLPTFALGCFDINCLYYSVQNHSSCPFTP